MMTALTAPAAAKTAVATRTAAPSRSRNSRALESAVAVAAKEARRVGWLLPQAPPRPSLPERSSSGIRNPPSRRSSHDIGIKERAGAFPALFVCLHGPSFDHGPKLAAVTP